MATTIKELKEKINEQNLKMKNLRETNRSLIEQHAKDQKELAIYKGQMDDAIRGIQDAMLEIYAKSICAEYGEDVYDDETGEYIGKRLVFKALRKNDYKLNMTDELIYPEDPKYISTITIGLVLPLEEKGEN